MINVLYGLVVVVACWLSYTDYKEHAIYMYQEAVFFCLVLLLAVFQGRTINCFAGMFLGVLCNFVIFAISRLSYRKECYGFGDVILHGCIGGLLGPEIYIHYFIFSSVIIGVAGAVISLVIFRNLKMEMPLAPWLFGSLAMWLFLGKPTIFLLL